MAQYQQVCPVEPISGTCPEPLIWVEVVQRVYLTWADFSQMLPAIILALLTAWGIRLLVRFLLNQR